MNDGFSLVVTLSSIPSSITRRPDVDLSSDEGSEEVFEDSNDEPVVKIPFTSTKSYFILFLSFLSVSLLFTLHIILAT